MNRREFPAISIEGDAIDVGAQLASRVVKPVVIALHEDAGADSVLSFYTALIVALHLQVAILLGKDNAAWIAGVATKEVKDLDVEDAAASGGLH